MPQLLSIIVPCYNEEASLNIFYDEVCKTASKIKEIYDVDCELLFINDGSKDNTLSILRELSKKDRDEVMALINKLYSKSKK